MQGRTEAGFIVRLLLPPGMTPEDALEELRTAIAFGEPRISLQYILPCSSTASAGPGSAVYGPARILPGREMPEP